MSEIKAILCDFDGVISDSGEDTFKSWEFALSQHGIVISKEEYFLEEGRSSEEILCQILKKRNLNTNISKEILHAKNEHYRATGRCSFYPGSTELLEWAQRNKIKFSVVSGGSKERLFNTQNAPFLNKADLVITASDVSSRKPSPEPYLKAAKILGVEGHACVIIENAPLGIQSARAAQIKCIAISSTLPSQYLSDANKIVNNLFQAIEELEKWQKK